MMDGQVREEKNKTPMAVHCNGSSEGNWVSTWIKENVVGESAM